MIVFVCLGACAGVRLSLFPCVHAHARVYACGADAIIGVSFFCNEDGDDFGFFACVPSRACQASVPARAC